MADNNSHWIFKLTQLNMHPPYRLEKSDEINSTDSSNSYPGHAKGLIHFYFEIYPPPNIKWVYHSHCETRSAERGNLKNATNYAEIAASCSTARQLPSHPRDDR